MPPRAQLLRSETLQIEDDENISNRVLEADGKDGELSKLGTSVCGTHLATTIHGVHECMGQLHVRVRVKCVLKRRKITSRVDSRA